MRRYDSANNSICDRDLLVSPFLRGPSGGREALYEGPFFNHDSGMNPIV